MTGGETIHGRHRPGSGSWIPLPEHGQHHAHTKAVVGPPGIVVTDRSGPIEPTEVVLSTVPITGLRSFDLGTVPASVTPPRTWRKAAWFAVGSSAAVLVALVVAATALVGRPSRWQTIDALPGLPGATDVITTLPTSGHPTTHREPGSTTAPPSSGSPDRIRTDPTVQGGNGAEPHDPAQPTTTSTDSGTSTDPRTTTTPEPTRSTITPLVIKAPVDADQIGDRTEAYYGKVVDDPEGAYAMTSGPMQGEGPEGIERRYQDITDVQVEKITIDPGTARTTNVVRLQHRDGSVTTQRRVLTFSAGDDPRITNETAG